MGVNGLVDADLERLAIEVRERARLRPDEIELAPRIALRLLGPAGIARVADLSTTTYLVRLGDGYRVVARAGAPDLNWAIAHELGHWALAELAHFKGSRAEEERCADYLATAILAPLTIVRAAHRALGDANVERVAAAFHISQKSTWLRLGEALGDERATVNARGTVRVRSAGAFPWETIDVVDAARSRLLMPGLARAKLRGGVDQRSVALRAR